MKTQLPDQSIIISDYLTEFKKIAHQHFGEQLRYLILYGSYARGDFRDSSDIDVLVVLNQIESKMQVIEKLADIKTDLILQHNQYLSTNPVSIDKFENSGLSFFRNVQREGVLL